MENPVRIYFISLIIFLIFPILLNAQSQNLKFEHLTEEDGLSGDYITGILQDNQGFMWFATRNGLNRYDGYEFKVYKHDPTNSSTIGLSWVEAICQDKYGNLWIGTKGGGLDRYDFDSETFCHYKYQVDNPNSLCNNYVVSLFHDSKNNLWVATQNGLSRIPVTGKLSLSDSFSTITMRIVFRISNLKETMIILFSRISMANYG